ncbi:MAG: glutamine--fructose-6-phosphate transaminase (isomerizing) [Clostridia bacterium]|nr:glutamine--fructose-6-phosphate transaminase (isomerizing) [Clostridia bacterium]
MCGIMGYAGDKEAADIIIDGLENLEYRGYDSAGLAVNDNGDIKTAKTVGSPSGLRPTASGIKGRVGIGHTRWATHGAASLENAHPHASVSGMFSVVHNGIIENYEELRSGLEAQGVVFRSETDTEVIAHLLEKHYKGDLKGAVREVLPLLSGSYALGILCEDYPDVIVCAKLSSPLFAGTVGECGYLASDVSVLSGRCTRIYRLNDGEIGFLKAGSFKVFDSDGCRLRKTEIKIRSLSMDADRAGYRHYMLKEIYEQPAAVRRTLAGIISGEHRIKPGFLKMSDREIKGINKVRFVACGSAYHVGLVGAYVTERLFKRSSEACIASEFRYMHPCMDESTLVVIISQSGETADTLAAMRLAQSEGVKVVSIVNVESSTIAMESDKLIMTRADREIAVATTKAYSAQLAAVYALVIYLAERSGELDKREAARLLRGLMEIPDKQERILSSGFDYSSVTDRLISSGYVCFIGRGLDYCSALEASLKLKEVSYIRCEAYAAGELKHGTISLVDKNSLIIALGCCSGLRAKTLANVKETQARGAGVIYITGGDDDDAYENVIRIPRCEDIFYPLLEIIPMQLSAYHTALKLGREIDKPRNLAKSVTVE